MRHLTAVLCLLALAHGAVAATGATEEPAPAPERISTHLFQLTLLEAGDTRGEPLSPEMVGALEGSHLPVDPANVRVLDIITVRAGNHVQITTGLPLEREDTPANPTFARFEAALRGAVHPGEDAAPIFLNDVQMTAEVPYTYHRTTPDGDRHDVIEWRDIGFNVGEVLLPADRQVYLGELSQSPEFRKLYIFAKLIRVD